MGSIVCVVSACTAQALQCTRTSVMGLKTCHAPKLDVDCIEIPHTHCTHIMDRLVMHSGDARKMHASYYRATRPACLSHCSAFMTSSMMSVCGFTMPSIIPYSIASLGCMYSGRCMSCGRSADNFVSECQSCLQLPWKYCTDPQVYFAFGILKPSCMLEYDEMEVKA